MRYSIAEAKDHLPEIVSEVQRGARVELTREGKPVVVLVGVKDDVQLAQSRRDFWESYEELRREFDFAELGIDPDEVFGEIRE